MKLRYFVLGILSLALQPHGGAQTVIPLSPADTTVVARGDTVADVQDSVAAAGDSLLPWAQRVRQRIDRLVSAPMFETSFTGIGVYDITADSLVYSKDIRQTMRPASTAKVLTAITALQQLGGSYRFETSLYTEGAVEDSVLKGNVYIKAGMDPMFGHDDMRAFAAAIREMGIDSIAGEIRADVSVKDTLKWGEGWCWDDDMPPLRALLYNGRDRFMDEFFSALSEQGVKFTPAYSIRKVGTAKCAITRYHTIDQILMPMLKESDNTYAESLFYQLGAQDRRDYAGAKHSAAKVKAMISRMGLDASRYVVADGSGVSLYNYASPELLMKALVYARSRSNIYDHLYPALPVAGVDGTLERRMRGTAAQYNVHAKTGTLEGVITLAGYATSPEGHELAFAIFNQGVLHDRNARNFQDRVCRAITEK